MMITKWFIVIGFEKRPLAGKEWCFERSLHWLHFRLPSLSSTTFSPLSAAGPFVLISPLPAERFSSPGRGGKWRGMRDWVKGG
jgi:hypothetical protein